jgi:hypothetical protein
LFWMLPNLIVQGVSSPSLSGHACVEVIRDVP